MKTVSIVTPAAAAILGLCALVMTIANVRTSFARNHTPPTEPWDSVANWKSYERTSLRIGPARPRVSIIVFTDYECPACKQLAKRLGALRREYPTRLAVFIRQFPLEGHPIAPLAAKAAVCAEQQGKLEQFDSLLVQAPTLEGKTMVSWAQAAGVGDTTAFAKCTGSPATARIVDADIADGRRLGVVGTPTLLVDNEEYVGIPFGLESIVSRHLDRSAP